MHLVDFAMYLISMLGELCFVMIYFIVNDSVEVGRMVLGLNCVMVMVFGGCVEEHLIGK